MAETVQEFTLRQVLQRLESLEFEQMRHAETLEALQGRLSYVESRGDLSIARPTWRDLDNVKQEVERLKKSR